MKNLKNIFAKMIIIFTVLLVFASCKKDKEAKSEDSFDPTKYYITGEYLRKEAAPSSYSYSFFPNTKTHATAMGGIVSETESYKYSEGVLSIGDITFNIDNENVVSTNRPDLFKSLHLQKIPDADAFAGKTFRGTVATNGIVNGKSCLIKFTNTKKFTVSIDAFGQTGTGANYTLQNNGIATANTGNEGRLHLMTIADGKLYYSQYNAADKTHYYGQLTSE